MKKFILNRSRSHGLTLPAILIVIAILAILIGMLMPTGTPRRRLDVAVAQMEMQRLIAAIKQYQNTYDELPSITAETNTDITCGIDSSDIQDFRDLNGSRLVKTNSDLMAVLVGADFGDNAGYQLNKQRLVFFEGRIVSGTDKPGISATDYQYRDPWGNPYIISLDANHDGLVCDAVYRNPAVSASGAVGNLTNIGGLYYLNGSVMIWSRGPDGKASMLEGSYSGVNKDNVLSWR